MRKWICYNQLVLERKLLGNSALFFAIVCLAIFSFDAFSGFILVGTAIVTLVNLWIWLTAQKELDERSLIRFSATLVLSTTVALAIHWFHCGGIEASLLVSFIALFVFSFSVFSKQRWLPPTFIAITVSALTIIQAQHPEWIRPCACTHPDVLEPWVSFLLSLGYVTWVLTLGSNHRREQLAKLREELEHQKSSLGNLVKISKLSITDTLTELHNRRYITSLFEQECERTRRYGGTLCLLLIDMDHFKVLNAKHGSAMGDQALRTIGSLLHTALRTSDHAGRWGGEKFMVLLTETATDKALVLANRLLTVISEVGAAMTPDGFTASIGLGEWQSGDDPQELLARAEKALARAKERGRNRVVLDT